MTKIREIKNAFGTTKTQKPEPSEMPLGSPTEGLKSEVTPTTTSAVKPPVEAPIPLETEDNTKVIHTAEEISAEDRLKLETIEGIDIDDLIRYATKKKKELKSERMNIALYPSLKKRLRAVADKTNNSVNDLIIRLLDKGLAQYE